MTTSYEELQELIDLSKIKSAIYADTLELDLTETFQLMHSTRLEDFSDNIVFYGDDFKIIKVSADYDENYDNYFSLIELTIPSGLDKVVPITLDEDKMRYAEEYSRRVPVITQSMIEQDEIKAERLRKERENVHQGRMYKLREMQKDIAAYHSVEDVKDFTIFESYPDKECAYVVVPKFPKCLGSRTIIDEKFLDKYSRPKLDFVGYACMQKDYLSAKVYDTDAFKPQDELDEEYYAARHDILQKLVDDKKLVKVIGIAITMLDGSDTPKKFLERHLDSIKEYYKGDE